MVQRRRGGRAPARWFQVATCLAVGSLVSHAAALALNEPAGGQVLFGAWLQTDSQTPAQFNAALGPGYNASVMQISQNIPLDPYNYVTGGGGIGPEELIEFTTTDAAVFLTVYPINGLLNITPNDYTLLGNQLLNYTENYNRSVFLRFAPEMNGNWNIYGLQPLMYTMVWVQMYQAIKLIAPKVAIVWAPNTGQGYPYSMALPTNATEAAALDTNADGAFTYADSPFAPYWPGPEYVDWVGLSVYWKGPNSENVNADIPDGYCYDALYNYNSNNGQESPDPWYDTYCANTTNQACMFAESGAAYHDEITGYQGVSQVSLKQSWWQGCLTNASFFESFPRMKLMMQFEFQKNESDSGASDHRDYRLTNNSEVLSAFQTDLANASSLYTWANYRTIPTSNPSIVTATQVFTTTDAAGSVVTATSVVTTSVFSFVTVRNTQTAFPSLFGNTHSSAVRAMVTSLAMFATTCGVVLGGTIFLLRL
ncbi:MAG: hypothetical protein CYPHOPRED_005532 [Cyphobasidiales sp. Tagirdzhanova-0007]|nr:MAG: hypothetical protein CYPHOPRED_005532 [Cyphobasidiales sp. Tagirdzhanova-0007]